MEVPMPSIQSGKKPFMDGMEMEIKVTLRR